MKGIKLEYENDYKNKALKLLDKMFDDLNIVKELCSYINHDIIANIEEINPGQRRKVLAQFDRGELCYNLDELLIKVFIHEIYMNGAIPPFMDGVAGACNYIDKFYIYGMKGYTNVEKHESFMGMDYIALTKYISGRIDVVMSNRLEMLNSIKAERSK